MPPRLRGGAGGRRRAGLLWLQLALLLLIVILLPSPWPALAGTGGRAVHADVEWRVPVGCDFSGFFTEVVAGYLPFLLARGVPLKLLHEGCVGRSAFSARGGVPASPSLSAGVGRCAGAAKNSCRRC